MVQAIRGKLMAPIRVLLVDDSLPFLHSTARILAGESCVCIVGQFLSGQEALEEIASRDCDLVLVDFAMPGMNGLEVARRIKALPTPPRVVLLSLHDADGYREAALGCTDAFLQKVHAASQLLPLIRSMFAVS
jgi:DNA-binding NarL/FixJ family response regulator